MTAFGGGLPAIDGLEDLVEIGRGGFATVYRATQVRFDRVVAVKVLDVQSLTPTRRRPPPPPKRPPRPRRPRR